MIWRIVGRERMRFAIESEARIGYAARHSTHDGSEIGSIREVGIETVKAQYDIGNAATPIGREQSGDDAAIGDCLDREAACSSKSPSLDRLPGRENAEDSRVRICSHML
jgi:hypothetical protein